MNSRLFLFLACASVTFATNVPPPGTCVLSLRLISEPGGLRRQSESYIGDGFGLYEQANGSLICWSHRGDHSENGKDGPRDEFWTLESWQASGLRSHFRQAAGVNFSLNSGFLGPSDLRTRAGESPIVINGAQIRATCHWEGVNFDFSTNQLEYHLDDLAKKDQKGAELRDLLDAVAQLVGRHAMLLE